MKRILTTGIAAGKALPLNGPRLSFLQDNTKELTAEIIRSLVNYITNDLIVLHGCIISGTPGPGAIAVTAGSIFYNNEEYLVSAASITTTGSQIPLWAIVETFDVSDPAIFSDGSTGNVCSIKKFVLVAGPAGGSGVAGYVADYNSSTVKDLTTHSRIYAPGVIETVGQGAIQSAIVNLGAWNMQSASSITLSFPTGITKAMIRRISALVTSDDGTQTSDLLILITTSTVPGNIQMSTNIILNRSSAFANSAYSSTSVNRGYLYIEYVAS